MDFALNGGLPMERASQRGSKRAMTSLIVIALLVFLVFPVDSAWAHASTDATSFTDWHWRPDVIIVLTFLSTAYVIGWRRLRKRNLHSVKSWELSLYLVSMATVCLALLSPIDALGSLLFIFHMTQHELLMMVAAPLLLLANPLPALLWGLPQRLRYRLGHLLTRDAPVRRALKVVTWMGVTLPLYMLSLWGCHYSPVFEAALRDDLIHDLQHLSFFITGLLFWWPVINPAPKVHGYIPYGFRIFYVIAATLPTMLPVMGLVLSERIFYPYYASVPRLWGITILQDQSNGWAIMALAEGAAYLTAILLLVARMAGHEEKMLRFGKGFESARVLFLILLMSAGAALAGTQQELLPDGSLRPGTRITIQAGQEGEFLFRPEGVRFLSGRARIVSVERPFIDPEGREIEEFFIDVGKSPGIPWMHDEKPFRMRIHAETDFTLEARKTWEWTPEDDHIPLLDAQQQHQFVSPV
jgi:cytochrome c oxidase assembly factor CtaG